jgi:acetoin utilization deacetylase AcuC-like enzyme
VLVAYSERHALHRPEAEVLLGMPRGSVERPERAERIREALEGDEGFQLMEPTDHGVGPIEAVHHPGLVRFLEGAWSEWASGQDASQLIPDTVLHPALREGMEPAPEPRSPGGRLGYWCFETMTPVMEGTFAAARAAVDVALTAADAVLDGEPAAYALCRPPGHHAARAVFGGYCYLNNAAIAAEHLVRRTGDRVAVLDIDYHHGNGTQQVFYSRPDVLYVSLHAHPDRAYPHFAGWPDERGTGEGLGTNLNLPLPPACDDEGYLEHLDRALEAIDEFGAPVLVVSLGLDTYGGDPLSDLAVTSDAYGVIGRRIGEASDRVLVVQEGGYDLATLGQHARSFLRGVWR